MVNSYPLFLNFIAKDFVRQLLQTDPDLRPTADECLQHSWITVIKLIYKIDLQNPRDIRIDMNDPFRENITRSRRLSMYS